MAPVETAKDRLFRRGSSVLTLWALLATILAIAAVEVTWRWVGHRPTVVDSPALWAYHRRRLSGGTAANVALLGTSRMLTALSIDACRRRLPTQRVEQLAIQGSPPFDVLNDLAQDPAFHGTVICELPEVSLLPQAVQNYTKRPFLNFYHRDRSLTTDLQVFLEGGLQELFCCGNPALGVDKVLFGRLADGHWPTTIYVPMDFDRRQFAEYHLSPAATALARETTLRRMKTLFSQAAVQSANPRSWLDEALRLEPLVARIRAKGGNIAFVRFPSSGETWELENRYFPRKSYWDRFAATTSAITIHFLDERTLAAIKCPDTSHIDSQDADSFTDYLLDSLERKGLALTGARSGW